MLSFFLSGGTNHPNAPENKALRLEKHHRVRSSQGRLRIPLARGLDPCAAAATRQAKGASRDDKKVIIMEAIIKYNANKAVTTFLERKGYDILEEGWVHGTDAVDVIARDDEDMVFVDILVKSAGLNMPEEKPDRGKFERIAAAYLAELGDEENFEIRYDMVSILVLSDRLTLLRHHINALPPCNDLHGTIAGCQHPSRYAPSVIWLPRRTHISRALKYFRLGTLK